MDLARVCWVSTVATCLIAVVVLSLQKYYGYASVTLVVALTAALNIR